MAELYPIFINHHIELFHMDCLTIDSGRGDKDVNTPAITNHFTYHTQVIITSSQTAKPTVLALWKNS